MPYSSQPADSWGQPPAGQSKSNGPLVVGLLLLVGVVAGAIFFLTREDGDGDGDDQEAISSQGGDPGEERSSGPGQPTMSPTETVTDLWNALASGDCARALGHLSQAYLQNLGPSESEQMRTCQEYFIIEPGDEFETITLIGEGSGWAEVKVVGREGDQSVLDLIVENGAWKVDFPEMPEIPDLDDFDFEVPEFDFDFEIPEFDFDDFG